MLSLEQKYLFKEGFLKVLIFDKTVLQSWYYTVPSW